MRCCLAVTSTSRFCCAGDMSAALLLKDAGVPRRGRAAALLRNKLEASSHQRGRLREEVRKAAELSFLVARTRISKVAYILWL